MLLVLISVDFFAHTHRCRALTFASARFSCENNNDGDSEST